MTHHQPIDWEPEPLRWLGYSIVRSGRYRAEEQLERTGRQPDRPGISQRLWDFEPPRAWRKLMRMDG